MKLCRDCKHCRVEWFCWLISGYRFANCSKEMSPVSGKAEGFCSLLRDPLLTNASDICGYDGKWFEPKREPKKGEV